MGWPLLERGRLTSPPVDANECARTSVYRGRLYWMDVGGRYLTEGHWPLAPIWSLLYWMDAGADFEQRGHWPPRPHMVPPLLRDAGADFEQRGHWPPYGAASAVVTHADESRGSKAFSSVYGSVCLSVCLSAETTITNLATVIDDHEYSPIIINIRLKGQK